MNSYKTAPTFFAIAAILIVLLGIGGSAYMITGPGPKMATDSIRSHGVSDVQLTGYAWYGCDSEKDDYGANFTGTNSRGERVEGIACCRILTGCSVRY